MPKDRVTNAHQGYGFVEFRSEEDADYVIFFTSSVINTKVFISLSKFWGFDHQFLLQAIKVLNMIKLFGKPIRVNKVCCIAFYSDAADNFIFSTVLLSYDISYYRLSSGL